MVQSEENREGPVASAEKPLHGAFHFRKRPVASIRPVGRGIASLLAPRASPNCLPSFQISPTQVTKNIATDSLSGFNIHPGRRLSNNNQWRSRNFFAPDGAANAVRAAVSSRAGAGRVAQFKTRPSHGGAGGLVVQASRLRRLSVGLTVLRRDGDAAGPGRRVRAGRCWSARGSASPRRSAALRPRGRSGTAGSCRAPHHLR